MGLGTTSTAGGQEKVTFKKELFPLRAPRIV